MCNNKKEPFGVLYKKTLFLKILQNFSLSESFFQDEELHSKLSELPNSALAVLFGCNTLWLTIMFAILTQEENLTLIKSNFFTLIFDRSLSYHDDRVVYNPGNSLNL